MEPRSPCQVREYQSVVAPHADHHTRPHSGLWAAPRVLTLHYSPTACRSVLSVSLQGIHLYCADHAGRQLGAMVALLAVASPRLLGPSLEGS